MSRMTGEESALASDQFGYGEFSRVRDGKEKWQEKWQEDFTMNCSFGHGRRR